MSRKRRRRKPRKRKPVPVRECTPAEAWDVLFRVLRSIERGDA